jgi:hypothetical protein
VKDCVRDVSFKTEFLFFYSIVLYIAPMTEYYSKRTDVAVNVASVQHDDDLDITGANLNDFSREESSMISQLIDRFKHTIDW